MALREGVRCGLLQMAIDKVKDGIDPEEPFASDEHREYYERQVKDLQNYMDMVGPEVFSKTTFAASVTSHPPMPLAAVFGLRQRCELRNVTVAAPPKWQLLQ